MTDKRKKANAKARPAKARPAKARPARARPTKAKVLQARIPENLDDELRDRAANLGLSVSTVVRNVLLNTFDLVEGVVTDGGQLAQAMRGRATSSATNLQNPAEADDLSSVIAWQEAVLNRNGVCEKCNAVLPLGKRAAVGVPVLVRPMLLCLECLSALSTTDEENTAP